jgi:serine/threonine-protein kinase
MAGNPQVTDLLEEMLEAGRTPEEVCRDCPGLLAEVRQRWQAFCRIDVAVRAWFSQVGTITDTGPILSAAPDARLPQLAGYEVEEVLGRGGMGVVYKARHRALKRTVAVKMLAAGHANSAERARFKAEAEGVARLQHPNIVQIHEVGEADGRPFFVMEFVAGGSLAKRLAGRKMPPCDTALLVAALADAMHLAHCRNLVHRDLKPANVLLGDADAPIGACRPKVTDFGLARQLDADSGQTQVGVVLGTPSYMAPEQAEGLAHAAGPAADVYALGVILYECLTGRPPFHGATALETLERVRSAEPIAPSALNRQVPRDLETICLKCLRKLPEERYFSARELADDLERFVRGEPVTARPVGVAERLRKWVWRRPAAAGLLAAAALLLISVGIGAWLLYQQHAIAHARQEEIDHGLRATLEHERGALDESWRAHDLAKLTAANTAAKRAADIARNGGASAQVQQEAEALRLDTEGRLTRATKNQALLDAVLEVSAPQETIAYFHDVAGVTPNSPNLDEHYAAAFRRWGLDVDGTPEADTVARLRQEPEVVQHELIAALDAWMLERQLRGDPHAEWRRLFRLAEQLDQSARRRALRAWLVGEAPLRADTAAGMVGIGSPWPALWELRYGNAWRQLLEVRRQLNPQTAPVQTVLLLARAFAAVGDVARAEEVLRQASTARPHEVVLLDALGKLLARQRRFEQAIGYYEAARGQRPQLGVDLTRALLAANRATEAREVMQDLVHRQPHNSAFYLFLGVAAYKQQKLDEAQAIFRKALDLNSDLAEAYYCRGIILEEQLRDDEAVSEYQKAIARKVDFVEAHYNLGVALGRQRKYAAAEAAYRKAIELKPTFVKAFSNLGSVLNELETYADAEAACRRAIDLDPGHAAAHSNLGLALCSQGKYALAEAACRKAIDLQPDLAEAHVNLGMVLAEQRKDALSEAAFRKAIDLRPDFAVAHNDLGAVLLRRQQYADAEARLRKAIDLKPDYGQAHDNLGQALFLQQKHAAAEAAFLKAIEIRHGNAETYNNLGMVLGLQGKNAQAEVAFRKAVELQPRLVQAHVNLGSALLGLYKYVEAEAALRTAIDLKPDFGIARYFLGQSLMRQARFNDAATVLGAYADSLPAQDAWRVKAVQHKVRCEQFVQLDARLPAILSGKENPANVDERIDFAELCFWKTHYVAAACLYRDAFAAQPRLAEKAPADNRYLAACAAARAGCGQGNDADKLDDDARARWRTQALAWLRQDLTRWGAAPNNAQLQLWLRDWQADARLSGVRDQDALTRLPVEERKEWENLWADVNAMLARGSAPDTRQSISR